MVERQSPSRPLVNRSKLKVLGSSPRSVVFCFFFFFNSLLSLDREAGMANTCFLASISFCKDKFASVILIVDYAGISIATSTSSCIR